MLSFRLVFPFIALFFTLLLYWILHQTIVINNDSYLKKSNDASINFVRLKQESKVEEKERVKRRTPKPKQAKTPPKIQPIINKTIVNSSAAAPMMLPINVSQNNFINGGIIGQGLAPTSDAIAIVKVPPIYPRRAKMLKKEGYVKLRLVISKEGFVKEAVVIESVPKKLFDHAALQSVYDWKFKPKIENGVAIEQRATQLVEFKLR